MAKYNLSNKALEDLSEIWNYTCETWSEQQADFYYSMLIVWCKDLAKAPGIGKKYDAISPDLMGYKAYQHIIFYRIISHNEIEVVRILHSRMDLKNRMQD